MSKNIRWGIAGLGNIAGKFAEDLGLVKGGELYAVASRSSERAQAFAKTHQAPKSYGSYEEMFADSDVDAVYIATPHTSHAALAISAMEHGKHVLCEKPAGLNSTQVASMVKTARNQGVFLMEALWSRFNPTIRRVKEMVSSGEIGEIRYLHADFAFYALDRSEEGRLLNPEMAGGSLLDIGIYPVFIAYLLLGNPLRLNAVSRFYKTGVEIQTSMIFEYEQAQAILYSGLNSKSEMKAEISGERGSVFIQPRWHETQGYTIEKDGELHHFELPTVGKGYTYEIEEVHSCLEKGLTESTLWSHQNSLDLIGLLDEIRQQTGVEFPS